MVKLRSTKASVLPGDRVFGRRRARLRLLTPQDADALLGFFASHTPETIRQRYGYALTSLSPERAAELVGVDQSRDAAVGIFEGPEGPAGELVAVGRACLAPDGASAEVAFVVREDRRGRGMATALLETLAERMRQRGVSRLRAQVQYDNAPMLAVFRAAGASFADIAGGEAVEVTLDLGRRRLTGPASGRRRRAP